MSRIEDIMKNAPRYQGKPGHNEMVYWGPDEQAVCGRYYDGTPISIHPSEDEISRYWKFWTALASAEQKEVLQAMHDHEIAVHFQKAFKGKATETLIEGAMSWWIKYYPHEVKEFQQYIEWKKGTLRDPRGYDMSKSWKYKGAVPQKVKQFVSMVNPDLVKYAGKGETPFEKYFYKTFTKATIGGD